MNATKLLEDPCNIIITGVGGQGNVMASRLLSNMLSVKGYRITIGETFGASQRGGAVMSHIRVSENQTWSPQIPKGKAHIVVSLEPIEAIRILALYGNTNVTVLANSRPIAPVGVIAGELNYPPMEEIRKMLEQYAARVMIVDATEEALKLGNPILGNIIMIGATIGLGLLPVGVDEFRAVIPEFVPAKFMEVNLEAFEIGRRMAAA
jgi:indolepyruvate ferredoxin oxidoreductase beta subunit